MNRVLIGAGVAVALGAAAGAVTHINTAPSKTAPNSKPAPATTPLKVQVAAAPPPLVTAPPLPPGQKIPTLDGPVKVARAPAANPAPALADSSAWIKRPASPVVQTANLPALAQPRQSAPQVRPIAPARLAMIPSYPPPWVAADPDEPPPRFRREDDGPWAAPPPRWRRAPDDAPAWRDDDDDGDYGPPPPRRWRPDPYDGPPPSPY